MTPVMVATRAVRRRVVNASTELETANGTLMVHDNRHTHVMMIIGLKVIYNARQELEEESMRYIAWGCVRGVQVLARWRWQSEGEKNREGW